MPLLYDSAVIVIHRAACNIRRKNPGITVTIALLRRTRGFQPNARGAVAAAAP